MPKEKPLGIYATEKSSYVGMGATRRRVVNKRLWMVWEYDESAVLVQSVNQNLVPSGQKRVVSRKEFDERYIKEKDYYLDKTTMKPIWRPSEKSEEASAEDAPVDAPLAAAPETAVAPDAAAAATAAVAEDAAAHEVERSTRATFGIGLAYLKSGNKERAHQIFEELATKPGEFKRLHKHMFNDFGIGLRKSKLLDVALKHYARALGLSPEDENLYHNIARIYYEQGNMEKALENLDKSLELNPNLKESQMFRRYIAKKKKRLWNMRFDI